MCILAGLEECVYRIQTLNKISKTGLATLPSETFTVGDDAEDPDALLVRSADLHSMEFGKNLKAIARAGAGVNNIPVDRCSELGIVVFNTPGANANSVKELVIAGLLLAARNIHGGIQWVRENATLDGLDKVVESEKKRFAGDEIMGKTLGVLGLGAVGVMVSNAARALDMRVIGYDPFISVESAWGLSRAVERASTAKEVFAEADYISIHVPLNDDTRGMVGEECIRSMKPGARMLNFSRGGLVDDDAMLKGLDSGQVGLYVTDFPNSKIASHPRVLGVPHLGASTEEAEENCAVMAAQQVRRYLQTGVIRNSVNFPTCELGGFQGPRILVANRNVPTMVSQITSTLGSRGINIAHMLNNNRGDLAYNIIDIDGDVSPETLDHLREIDGVIFARMVKMGASS